MIELGGDCEENDEEDREWEECMKRRRMMFANMCSDRDPQPEFDGYRSISATLVDLLRSAGCGEGEGVHTPTSTPMGVEDASEIFANFRLAQVPGSRTPSLVSSASSEVESGIASPSRSGIKKQFHQHMIGSKGDEVNVQQEDAYVLDEGEMQEVVF